MALILEKLIAVTPPGARQGLRRLKYYLMGRMSPSAYWNLAARISAKAAICTDCVNEKDFFESGKREASLLRKKELLGPDLRVINIGCGVGRIENVICSHVGAVVGVDVSSRMIDLARQKVQASNVCFQAVDGETLHGIESNQYDLCVSFMVFQHIPRLATASYMREVARVLKPGGRFLFQIPLKTPERDTEPPANHPFGIRFYPRCEVEDLLQQARLKLQENFNFEGKAPSDLEMEDPRYEFYLAIRPFRS